MGKRNSYDPLILNIRQPKIIPNSTNANNNEKIILRFRDVGLRTSNVPSVLSALRRKTLRSRTILYSLGGGLAAGLGLIQNPTWFFLAFAMGVFALMELL